jgi:hypothetical protein
MIDNLRKLHGPVQGEARHQGASIAISFVYCDSHVHRTEEDIAASFLSQLILSHPELTSEETQQKLNRLKRLGHKPSFSELIRLLKVESRRLTCHYLFLDAFDEIPDDGERSLLCKGLFKLAEESSVRVFVTSRPIPPILQAFQNLNAVPYPFQASSEDIAQYVRTFINQATMFRARITSRDGLLQKIVNTVTERAAGM